MGGLLYKDFVAASGKKYLAIISILTLAYMVLRIVFPGWNATDDFVAYNDLGEKVNMLDAFFVTYYVIFLLFYLGSINNLVGTIVTGDKKNKIMNYLGAMPLKANTYVASKYIFIGICAYATFSLLTVLGVTCMAFCEEGWMLEAAELVSQFALIFVAVMLFSVAIELPMFMLFGKEKAMLIKTGLWLALALFVVGFMMFGDLVWFQSVFNIQKMIDWAKTHMTIVALSNIFSIVGILVLYFLSYKITCYFVNKGVMSYE